MSHTRNIYSAVLWAQKWRNKALSFIIETDERRRCLLDQVWCSVHLSRLGCSFCAVDVARARIMCLQSFIRPETGQRNRPCPLYSTHIVCMMGIVLWKKRLAVTCPVPRTSLYINIYGQVCCKTIIFFSFVIHTHVTLGCYWSWDR